MRQSAAPVLWALRHRRENLTLGTRRQQPLRVESGHLNAHRAEARLCHERPSATAMRSVDAPTLIRAGAFFERLLPDHERKPLYFRDRRRGPSTRERFGLRAVKPHRQVEAAFWRR